MDRMEFIAGVREWLDQRRKRQPHGRAARPGEAKSFDEVNEMMARFNRRAGIAALLIVASIVFGIAGCTVHRANNPTTSSPEASTPPQGDSIYEKVAALDAYDAGRANPTRAEIDQTTTAILGLSARCNATPVEIADGSQVAHASLAESGIAESRYSIITAVSGSIPPKMFGTLSCDEVFAAYVTIRKS